jgi:hypothetical protein
MAWFVDVGLSSIDSSRVLCRQLESSSTRLVVNEEGRRREPEKPFV